MTSRRREEGWEYFGEAIDRMDAESQRFVWQTTCKGAKPFEDWLAGLYRGPRRANARRAQLGLFDEATAKGYRVPHDDPPER